ncbi:MAG: YbhB/YbcL family Raf kinase inhibitor-like protein [Candidatus Acidiferrales bacterium]
MRITSLRLLVTSAFLLAASAIPAAAQQGPPPGGGPPGGGGRPGGGGPPPGPPLQLSTSAYSDGGTIPDKYTCAGPGGFASMTSMPVEWKNPPAGTQSFILLLHDPDAHARKSLDDITHWIVYNIPGDSTGLPEGVKADAPASVGTQGKNIMGQPGFMGPCAPPGPPHHYTLELLALDTKLDLPAGASRDDILKAADGHVLTGTVYIGLFHRAPGSSMGPPPR